MKPILWLATARTKVKFIRPKGEHSSLNVHLRRVGVVTPTILLLLISCFTTCFTTTAVWISTNRPGTWSFHHQFTASINSVRGNGQVSTCQGCHQHQDLAMPVGSIPISEETALTQDKYLQEPQQNRRQGTKSESINSVQQSSSSGTQINEDFIKDEYDYLRFTH